MAVVRCAESLSNLGGIASRLPDGNRASHEPLPKRLSLEQFFNDVWGLSFEPNIIDSDNVGMIQGGGSAGFLLKSSQMIGIVARRRPNQLQRYVASKSFIARAKDFSHRPCAD